MIRVAAVRAFMEELAGHPLHEDEGIHHGSARFEVEGVLVTWMATREALAHAAERGLHLVIAHESLYYPYDASVRHDNPVGWADWPINSQRRELLEAHDLTLMRLHGTLDEICIYDAFAALLGLGEPVWQQGTTKVYEIAPRPLAALVAEVKERTGMSALRVSAPQGLEQVVHRVGLPWGGMGLFVNVPYQQALIARGCDVFIAGESDSYGFRFAAECGLPMIETSHELSENPGLRRYCTILAARFPELRVEFYECPTIWQCA